MSQVNINTPGPADSGDRAAAAGINLVTVLIVLIIVALIIAAIYGFAFGGWFGHAASTGGSSGSSGVTTVQNATSVGVNVTAAATKK